MSKNNQKKILFFFGTRPEAIKLAPLIMEMNKFPKIFKYSICISSQHQQMLKQVLHFFKIKPDFDLKLMKPGQSLFDITSKGLEAFNKVIQVNKPDMIIVQGDTTTALVGALAGYYNKIKIIHVEAGLRSHDKYSPFPEEINRSMVGKLADYNFTPTKEAVNNLHREGVRKNIYNVGNTVIDALLMGLKIIKKIDQKVFYKKFDYIDFNKKIILVTGHRRENFGEPLKNICLALKEIAKKYKDVEIVYPVHLNPNVKNSVFKYLGGVKNIHLIEPLDYPDLIWLMDKSYLIITDSGGIQEEAPTLGKPILITRDVTERTEGIKAGTAKLVGSDRLKIVNETTRLLNNRIAYEKMSKAVNPYGNGDSCKKIINILRKIK